MRQEADSRAFWARVDRLMQDKGWSENELAKQSGLSQSGLNGAKNRNGFPRLDSVISLARALGTTVEYLSFGDEAMRDRDIVYGQRRPDLVVAEPGAADYVGLTAILPRVLERIGEVIREELSPKPQRGKLPDEIQADLDRINQHGPGGGLESQTEDKKTAL